MTIEDLDVFIRSKPIPAVTIVANSSDGLLSFQILPDRGFPIEVAPHPLGAHEVEELKSAAQQFEGDIASAAYGAADVSLLMLKAQDLYEACLPSRLRTFLEILPPATLLQVSTNEQWIPWEHFHDGVQFLGERFRIARLPRATLDDFEAYARSSDRVGWPPMSVTNVVGRDLDALSERNSALLFEDHRAVQVSVRLKECGTTLNPYAKSADVLHFTCHGTANPPVLMISKGGSEQRDLRPADVSNLNIKQGCFVFTNSCDSGRGNSFLKGTLSFAFRFIGKGALAYIGTLGPVSAVDADSFARAFYQKVFEQIVSRSWGDFSVFIDSFFTTIKLTKLLYCYYGNPLAAQNAVRA